MPFIKTGSNAYKSPSGRTFTKKQVKMYYATDGFTKKKAKVKVNNRMKNAMGRMNPKTNRIEINVRAHKKKGKIDKAELASTIKHELMHVKHPKMTEKQVYKRTAKTKIPYAEQQKLLLKLRHKKLNYKMGATKRKLGIKRGEKTEPGALISRAKRLSKKERMAIMGLV